MASLGYSFLDNDFFGVYQSIEPPKVEVQLPLMDFPINLDWATAIAEDGTPIVKDNRPKLYMVNDNNPEPEIPTSAQEVPKEVPQQDLKQPVRVSSNTNAKIVINTLMNDLGLTKAQASGIAGVLQSESNINPQAFNVKEKKGTYYKSSANNKGAKYGEKNSPWSYGAGIGQWTFTDRKEKALMGGLGLSREEAISLIQTKGIESLPLESQIKMLEYELTNEYKNTLEGIKKCKTASEAAATFHCHAIAGYSTSTEKATIAEINKINKKYSTVGSSSLINKSMKNAENFNKSN